MYEKLINAGQPCEELAMLQVLKVVEAWIIGETLKLKAGAILSLSRTDPMILRQMG